MAYPSEQFKTQSATTAAAERDSTMQLWQELRNSQSVKERMPAAAAAPTQSVQWLMTSDAAAEETDSQFEES